MTSIQERLQQLLDGELDPADIADDPTLVSLADRIYGIKIAPVQPVKASLPTSEDEHQEGRANHSDNVRNTITSIQHG